MQECLFAIHKWFPIGWYWVSLLSLPQLGVPRVKRKSKVSLQIDRSLHHERTRRCGMVCGRAAEADQIVRLVEESSGDHLAGDFFVVVDLTYAANDANWEALML